MHFEKILWRLWSYECKTANKGVQKFIFLFFCFGGQSYAEYIGGKLTGAQGHIKYYLTLKSCLSRRQNFWTYIAKYQLYSAPLRFDGEKKNLEQKCFSSLASCRRLSVSLKFTIQSDPNSSQTWFYTENICQLVEIFILATDDLLAC